MCRPDHFTVSYSINPWMDPGEWANSGGALRREAERQWSALYAALAARDAVIDLFEPAPDLPDLVFTANAAIVLDGKALLSRFRHQERQPEEPVFAAAFGALMRDAEIAEIETMPGGIVLEGAGDCIFDAPRGRFWMGCGQRSDPRAAAIVADRFAVDCIPLELAQASFYHLDTAFCALPTGDVIYYPEAFTRSGLRAIEEAVAKENRIALRPEDANAFSANAVSFDHCVVMSSCAPRLRGELEERGFTIVTTPLQAFMRSGGSACCLTLRLDRTSEG